MNTDHPGNKENTCWRPGHVYTQRLKLEQASESPVKPEAMWTGKETHDLENERTVAGVGGEWDGEKRKLGGLGRSWTHCRCI